MTGAARAGVDEVVAANLIGRPSPATAVSASPRDLPALGQLIRTRSDLFFLRRAR